VELACNLDDPLPEGAAQTNCTAHHISFSRSPLSTDNLKAYRELKHLLTEGHYDIVHTHTPNASTVVRLACRKLRKQGMKVFYTAHGFHFYTGAPLANWLLFYPIEWLCSRWTDVLITINREDYARAQKKFHAKQTVYIPGVGLDTAQFGCYNTRDTKRQELGLPADAKVLLTVGELNENKNQSVILRAMANLDDSNLHYVLCGRGPHESSLRQLAEDLGLTGRVHLLGFRRDVPEIYPAADLYLCPSFREGLNVSIMEAMASGLPVICSDIRGNRDLVEQNKGGLLFRPDDMEGFAAAIRELLDHSEICIHMGKYNQTAVEQFSMQQVLGELKIFIDDYKS
jgi:glycosyltransferase involved in cell wall biosynthesis